MCRIFVHDFDYQPSAIFYDIIGYYIIFILFERINSNGTLYFCLRNVATSDIARHDDIIIVVVRRDKARLNITNKKRGASFSPTVSL